MALRLWFHPATPDDARDLLKKAAAFIRARVRVEHPLPVHLLPLARFDQARGRDTTGYFWYGPWGCAIDIAEGQELDQLVLTLFHEVRHYEQWRDTGKIWENGVEDVAKEWLRAFKRRKKTTKRGQK